MGLNLKVSRVTYTRFPSISRIAQRTEVKLNVGVPFLLSGSFVMPGYDTGWTSHCAELVVGGQRHSYRK